MPKRKLPEHPFIEFTLAWEEGEEGSFQEHPSNTGDGVDAVSSMYIQSHQMELSMLSAASLVFQEL